MSSTIPLTVTISASIAIATLIIYLKFNNSLFTSSNFSFFFDYHLDFLLIYWYFEKNLFSIFFNFKFFQANEEYSCKTHSSILLRSSMSLTIILRIFLLVLVFYIILIYKTAYRSAHACGEKQYMHKRVQM